MAVKKITSYECTCERCGHTWKTRNELARVRMCPGCRSVKWDIPKLQEGSKDFTDFDGGPFMTRAIKKAMAKAGKGDK